MDRQSRDVLSLFFNDLHTTQNKPYHHTPTPFKANQPNQLYAKIVINLIFKLLRNHVLLRFQSKPKVCNINSLIIIYLQSRVPKVCNLVTFFMKTQKRAST